LHRDFRNKAVNCYMYVLDLHVLVLVLVNGQASAKGPLAELVRWLEYSSRGSEFSGWD
jgi:hypothetical protein